MDFVSVSVYNDADLLRGCLESIREHAPEAGIQVVDGRYATFRPDAADNSTDATPDIAREFGASYHAAGPFDREVNKHRYRVANLPADATALFMDADERLLDARRDALSPTVAYSPRIFNALVYSDSGTRVVYWPRVFRPMDVLEVARWDKYLFDVPHERTDALTIAHRHDLRDAEYRRAKYERFEREDRSGRYAEAFEKYLQNNYAVETTTCPACGKDAFTWSPATNQGAGFSRVGVCLDGDGCHRAIERIDDVGDYRYLPDDLDAGFADAPERLRLELLDAGCDFVNMASPTVARDGFALDQLRPSIERWVRERYDVDVEQRIFESA